MSHSWRFMATAVIVLGRPTSRQEVPVSSIPRPDLSARPLRMTCEHTVNARPEEVFAAWTKRFDTWFAQPGTLVTLPPNLSRSRIGGSRPA